ncbi:MAG: hypothetical protein SGILL_009739 [Bacillariaceae sp.]
MAPIKTTKRRSRKGSRPRGGKADPKKTPEQATQHVRTWRAKLPENYQKQLIYNWRSEFKKKNPMPTEPVLDCSVLKKKVPTKDQCLAHPEFPIHLENLEDLQERFPHHLEAFKNGLVRIAQKTERINNQFGYFWLNLTMGQRRADIERILHPTNMERFLRQSKKPGARDACQISMTNEFAAIVKEAINKGYEKDDKWEKRNPGASGKLWTDPLDYVLRENDRIRTIRTKFHLAFCGKKGLRQGHEMAMAIYKSLMASWPKRMELYLDQRAAAYKPRKNTDNPPDFGAYLEGSGLQARSK